MKGKVHHEFPLEESKAGSAARGGDDRPGGPGAYGVVKPEHNKSQGKYERPDMEKSK